jgi:diaminopimelate epimerase
MTPRVAVTKMHGARNDFIVLDRRIQTVDDLVAFARWSCDRHAGIGADGVLAIESSERADARMRVINADGSEAEMCGNGIRCVARYLDEAGEGDQLRIETLAGIIETAVIERAPEYLVRADMGVPGSDVRPAGIDGAAFVDMGNPHVVLTYASVDDVDLVSTGERFAHHPSFPNGTNVHVMAVEGVQTLRVRHYERGVGLTQACGTGAVACAVAAIAEHGSTSPVTVHVPGGDLVVEWSGPGTHAYMTGPAIRVFDTAVVLPVAVHA